MDYSNGHARRKSHPRVPVVAAAKKVFVCCLLSLFSAAHGAEEEQNDEDGSGLPDLEFLEFLGQFETDAGEWIDPASLMTAQFNQLLNAAVIDDLGTDDANDDVNIGDTNDVQPSNDQ